MGIIPPIILFLKRTFWFIEFIELETYVYFVQKYDNYAL